ncbi:MAG TPA: hypothetical protein VMY98_04380 [Anaerolineae bacterium]|nr:hypothetical protein [Anaerolineae bacterium]
MTNIRIGDRIFFPHRNGYGQKTQQASGLVLEISRRMGHQGPELFRVSCDTPGVWIGTYDPKSKTRIADIPEWEVWMLK